MLKQVFLAHFEPVVTRFGPWKIPECLENGPFSDQKWVKNGSKRRLSKSHPRPFGMLKQVFLAHFEPVVTRFGPWKIPKYLENGPYWDRILQVHVTSSASRPLSNPLDCSVGMASRSSHGHAAHNGPLHIGVEALNWEPLSSNIIVKGAMRPLAHTCIPTIPPSGHASCQALPCSGEANHQLEICPQLLVLLPHATLQYG